MKQGIIDWTAFLEDDDDTWFLPDPPPAGVQLIDAPPPYLGSDPSCDEMPECLADCFWGRSNFNGPFTGFEERVAALGHFGMGFPEGHLPETVPGSFTGTEVEQGRSTLLDAVQKEVGLSKFVVSETGQDARAPPTSSKADAVDSESVTDADRTDHGLPSSVACLNNIAVGKCLEYQDTPDPDYVEKLSGYIAEEREPRQKKRARITTPPARKRESVVAKKPNVWFAKGRAKPLKKATLADNVDKGTAVDYAPIANKAHFAASAKRARFALGATTIRQQSGISDENVENASFTFSQLSKEFQRAKKWTIGKGSNRNIQQVIFADKAVDAEFAEFALAAEVIISVG
ncbi:hypothetical protein ARSEF4850_003755 [Beauveria asiatica]